MCFDSFSSSSIVLSTKKFGLISHDHFSRGQAFFSPVTNAKFSFENWEPPLTEEESFLKDIDAKKGFRGFCHEDNYAPVERAGAIN